jgi:hypothetical protein
MPDLIEIAKLSEDERNTIWRLFAIRFKIWDGEQLSSEDRSSWDTARTPHQTGRYFIASNYQQMIVKPGRKPKSW